MRVRKAREQQISSLAGCSASGQNYAKRQSTALQNRVLHPVTLAVPYSRFITHIAQNMTFRFVAAPSTDCTSRVHSAIRVESGVVILTRRFGMAIQAHLVELERKHKILEDELHEALVHLSTDDLQIAELKRRKLMVKDQIERLKHASDETFH